MASYTLSLRYALIGIVVGCAGLVSALKTCSVERQTVHEQIVSVNTEVLSNTTLPTGLEGRRKDIAPSTRSPYMFFCRRCKPPDKCRYHPFCRQRLTPRTPNDQYYTFR
ncbi:unnamed protein product [Zymoseptoria tritici ST99CH_3D7]|uniref:Uncharacterized protein n=1 Tax=Zymoseptoria tritici (strain ST99CH_3D7) TaxID=1276538 RepID=A0A1X7RDI5_ZYMT9|nr:unnamed protein product [Zymoseptoria tritici ST99CH_3D7]